MGAVKIRVLTVAAVLLQAFVLRWVLQYMIAPKFGYQGIVYRAPDRFDYPAMIALTVVVALLLPRRLTSPSATILWVVFTFSAAPSIQIPQYVDLLSPSKATHIGIAVAVGFLVARGISAHPPLASAVKPSPVSPATLGLILTVGALAVYGAVLLTTGFNLGYLSLNSVYAIRAEFITETAGNPIIGYGLPAVQNVINPLLIGMGLLRRGPSRIVLVTLGILGQAIIYTTVGTKETLFSIVFVLAVAPLARRKSAGAWFPLGVMIAAILAAVTDLRTHSVALTVLTTRRVMIVPGTLTAAWVYVFDIFPQLHFVQEMHIGPPPTLSATHLVGQLIANNVNTSANTSMFGHGYAEYGYAGLLIECVIFGFLLRLADWSTRGLPALLASALFIMPAEAISEASIFTVILSHSFLFAALIGAVLPRDGWDREPTPTARAVRSRSSTAALT